MMYFFTQRPSIARPAFSLVESLVAIAIFSIVAVTMVGTLTTLIAENRKARTQKVVMDNVQSAVDSMIGDIRNGSNPVITFGGSRLEFEPAKGDPDSASDNIVYALSTGGTAIMRSLDGGSSWQRLTAPEFSVEHLSFLLVYGGDSTEPIVQISLAGEAGTDAKTKSQFSIQTSTAIRGISVVKGVGGVCAAEVVSGFLSRLLFDDASSGFTPTTAHDEASVTNANLRNGAQWGAGKWCNATWFDGIDDYVDYPSPRFLDFANLYQTGGLTVSAWIYPTSANPGADRGPGYDMSGKCSGWVSQSGVGVDCPSACIANTDGFGTPDGWAFFVHSDLSLGFHADNGTVQAPWKISSSNTVKLNTWQHVAVTWDGVNRDDTSGIHLYINATDGLEETGYRYEPDVDNRFGFGNDNQDSMTVGACKDWVFDGGVHGNLYFKGAIDDFRIYHGVLGSEQIKDLARQGSYTIHQEDF